MAPFSHGMKGQPETVPSLALVGKDNRLATLAMMEAIITTKSHPLFWAHMEFLKCSC